MRSGRLAHPCAKTKLVVVFGGCGFDYMDRAEVRSRIVEYFKGRLSGRSRPTENQHIQIGDLFALFQKEQLEQPPWKQAEVLTLVNEIVHELAYSGFIYFGMPGSMSSHDYYPWITVTEYGKAAFMSEDWLPHDPEGYMAALKTRVPELEEVTLAYIGESVSAFNRRHLLSATITLGVASENIMLVLIEAYAGWIKDPKRKAAFEKRIANKWISTQYNEFKSEFKVDVRSLPKQLQGDWETYLDGIFNFIRLNRNSAGHPTGKQMSAKAVYANLQIFADYSRYVFDLIHALQ